MNKRIAHNIFEGINPVLNEKFLQIWDWQDFHNAHLVDIRNLLKSVLLERGYVINLEESVQVYKLGDTPTLYRSDVLISKSSRPSLSEKAQSQSEAIPTVATQILPIRQMNIPEESPSIMAIVIRKRRENKPITWIEMLSPSNKLPSQTFYDYQFKRKQLIDAGVCFIELDFIHTQPPTFYHVEAYTDGGYPYHLSVSVPRPTIQEGTITMYHFGVADKIPTIDIPLEGDDTHIFDFNAAYQKTFVESSYGLELDYHDLDLSTYLERDRQYILKRIASALDDESSTT